MTTTNRISANGNKANEYVQTTGGWSKPSLALGVGAGMLLATLLIGSVAQFQPQTTQSPSGVKAAQQSDWKQAAAQAGMVVLTKQELEQQLSAAKTAAAQQKASELANQSPKTVHVYIQPGMGTTDVAMLLQAAGVLENGNALINLRSAQVNPIRSGIYDLPLHGDPQAVMKAISTPPRQ